MKKTVEELRALVLDRIEAARLQMKQAEDEWAAARGQSTPGTSFAHSVAYWGGVEAAFRHMLEFLDKQVAQQETGG